MHATPLYSHNKPFLKDEIINDPSARERRGAETNPKGNGTYE